MRHTAVDVPAGMCYGQTDVPLRPTFPEEAKKCAEQLQNLHFDAVYSSPLSRCTRLATACGYATAKHDHRIKELNFGEWEMQYFSQIKDPRLQLWYEDYIHIRTTGGESFIDQYNRVSQFIKELQEKQYENVLAFTHGGVLICAQIYAGVISMENAFDKVPPYGSLIILELPHRKK